jgi:hypothetical protein
MPSVSYFTAPGQPAFTSVATIGPIEWVDAFDEITNLVLFRQAFQTAITAFSNTALNTAYPTAVGGTTYILVREADYKAIGGGQMTWNRYFACTPPQRVEYTTSSRVFPGLRSATTYPREPVAFPTQTKITRNYHLVSPTSGALPAMQAEDRVTVTANVNAPLLSEVYLLNYTNPTAASYIASVTTDSASAGSFSIRAEADYPERWMGNFYAIVETKVKAK